MNNNLEQFKKNIITWYPIQKGESVLYIGNDDIILNELNKKTEKVLTANSFDGYEMTAKFDYVVLIGNLENLKSEEEILGLISDAQKHLSKNGKILLVTQNKFGMKYWAGGKQNSEIKPYNSIITERPNYLGLTQIKNILNELKLSYKFYYPLPDYKITNVIYTDDYLPNMDSISARFITFYNDYTRLFFSERDAYKQLVKDDKNLFPFFSNSFFIEISESKKFSDVKFVSFGVTRKEEYRIKTIIRDDVVEKSANSDQAEEHIKNIGNNIEILKNNKIDCIDKFENGKIVSKFIKDAKTYNHVLMDIYDKNGLNAVLEEIKKYEKEMLYKLGTIEDPKDTIFEKYGIEIDPAKRAKLHFTENGILDLTFQNCFYKMWKNAVYDQEWYEKNVPIEFILYRAVLNFSELTDRENFDDILDALGIKEYKEEFRALEENFQKGLSDSEVWAEYVDSFNHIVDIEEMIKGYENEIKAKATHNEQLQGAIEEYKEGIANLTSLIETKDAELVNYANQLRSISNSFSWKITKPIRFLSWMLNPTSGMKFIDRIMPPGGRRRIAYEKKLKEKRIKQAEEFYKRQVENYYKQTDEETAKYWEGIDHRYNVKREKNEELAKNNELTDYEKWIDQNKLRPEYIEAQTRKRFLIRPKISIVVPLYNTDIDFFRELLYTVHLQTYKNWELCLADGSEKPTEEITRMIQKDKRIKYKFLGKNGGISENTNEAIKMATGEYIALLDHDDMLDITALYEVVKKINEDKNVDFIYSDEDKFHFIDEPFYAPYFKPDFAPDTLRASNYICHLSVFKKSLLKKIGGFRTEFNGAQDYDIILRAVEKAKKIAHIQKILYHWRVHTKSTSMLIDVKPYAIIAGQKAIEEHLKRIGLKGKVYEGLNVGTYGIDYEVIGNPKVTILVPNKDNIETLRDCINSILEKTTYKNYEILVVENNSENAETFDYYKELEKNGNIKIINYEEKGFNYSKIINFGVRQSDGEYIIQLNNDTTIITPDWIEKMLGFCQREDVGAVGAKLYYPDETIQHAGIIVGARQVAAHVFRGLSKEDSGYFEKMNLIQNLNAVTAACIMTKKSIYEEVGFMNEDFAVAFNDVDFCLRIRKTGKLIVYNPFVELFHYESKTREDDNAPENLERFQGEIKLFLETWKDKLATGDEYYNPNLSLESDQYDLKLL